MAGTLLQRLAQAGDIALWREQADLKHQEMSVTIAVYNTIPLAEHSWSPLYINFLGTDKSFAEMIDESNGTLENPRKTVKGMEICWEGS